MSSPAAAELPGTRAPGRPSPAALRWLVTGARGQLGTELVAVLRASGVPQDRLRGLGSGELDISNGPAIERVCQDFRPQVILNAAAYTAVDAAETDRERAHAVNATGPGLLAAAAVRHGARLVHLSTDYVFDGRASAPYEPDDPTGPQSVYGQTKLAGEIAVREIAGPLASIVRTAWVYGATGSNFVKTMLGLEASRPTVSVVVDQLGSPTWSRDLAAGLVEFAVAGPPNGTYHATNSSQASWFDFAREIFRLHGADPDRVRPTTSAEFPRPAPRPAYSVLSGARWQRAGLTPLRGWQDALAEFLHGGAVGGAQRGGSGEG
jgi:dTDP-4-dehydrorhamnose reductase